MPALWEQWRGEPHKAFAAFTVFRGLTPSTRSLPAAYRAGMADPLKKKISGQWRAWAGRYQWVERALAYDRHLDTIRRAAAETVVAEVEATRVREIEIGAMATLKQTAALAQSDIADVVSWDEAGDITVKASDALPQHITGAIKKIKKTYDRLGNPHLEVEMHSKVEPNNLMGQHFNLWDPEKRQQERAATNVFLELLNAMKAGKFENLGGPPATIHNLPPGVTIETEAALIPPQVEKMEEGDI